MKIVSPRILRMSLLISSILFFNYMYRLISTSSKNDNKPITQQSPNLKGKEHFHKWVSLVYIVVMFFKYKTINEQFGLYVGFFILINVAYYPFNCICKDPAGWVCKPNTAPTDPRCQKIIAEIDEMNEIIDRDMAAIKASKTRVFEALVNNLFPVFPVPTIPKLPRKAFNLPHLQSISRVVPRISISCEVSVKAILKALKKRVLNKIGEPIRKKRWGKRFRR